MTCRKVIPWLYKSLESSCVCFHPGSVHSEEVRVVKREEDLVAEGDN